MLMLYGMMILLVVWQDIPQWTSNLFNDGCIVMMMISLVLHARRNIHAIRSVSRPAE